MIVLDASVLIAHLDAADAHHGAAQALLQRHASEELAVSVLTLAEVLVGPTRRGVTSQAVAALSRLGVTTLDLTDGIALAAVRARTGVKLPDACVLHAALLANAAVATFDARLQAAGQAQGLTMHSS